MEMYCVSCNVGEYYDHLSLLLACVESSILPQVISVILTHKNLMEQVLLSCLQRRKLRLREVEGLFP